MEGPTGPHWPELNVGAGDGVSETGNKENITLSKPYHFVFIFSHSKVGGPAAKFPPARFLQGPLLVLV